MFLRSIGLLSVLVIGHAVSGQEAWTLDRCIERAEAKNLSMRMAEFDQQFAGEDLRAARWGFLPDLNLAATHGYNWGKAIDRYTNTFATDRVRTNNFFLSSNWMLFQGLRQHKVLKRADLDVQSSAEALDAMRVEVITDVVGRFLDMLSAQERIRVSQVQVARTNEQIALTDALVEAGRSARVELLDLNAQQAREELTVVTNENAFQQARLRMAQLLQLSPQEAQNFTVQAPAIEQVTPTLPDADMNAIVEDVIKTHPAYQNARLQMESAERSIEITRVQLLPTLSLGATVSTGYSGRNVEAVGEPLVGAPTEIGFTEGGETVYTPNLQFNTEVRPFSDQLEDNVSTSAAFTLNVPIFNRMTNRTAAAQARVRFEQARLRMSDQRLQLEIAVMQALNDQRAAYRQFEAASRAVAASEEAMRYANERFEQGAVNALGLTTAKTNLNLAQADMITARYAYLMATGSLDILRGRPVSF